MEAKQQDQLAQLAKNLILSRNRACLSAADIALGDTIEFSPIPEHYAITEYTRGDDGSQVAYCSIEL